MEFLNLCERLNASMQYLRTKFRAHLNKGAEYHSTPRGRQISRQVNFMNTLILFLVGPVVLIYNIIVRDYGELKFISLVMVIFIGAYISNRRGKTELSNFLALSAGIAISYIAVFVNEKQVAAPFGNLLVTFGALLFVRKQWLKNTLVILALISFVVTGYYNRKYLPFDGPEYFLIIIIVGFYYLALRYWDNQNRKYRREIEDNNKQLKAQNTTIKEQADKLIKTQGELHHAELTQKQKDLDTVLASQAMQIQLKENTISQLDAIARSKDYKKEIRSIKTHLLREIETEKRLHFHNENMSQVNAALYERLLEKHPDLTKAEREMCAYLRIGLSTKEIATLRNINENSVNILKTRVRNKLGLESNSELGSYLIKF